MIRYDVFKIIYFLKKVYSKSNQVSVCILGLKRLFKSQKGFEKEFEFSNYSNYSLIFSSFQSIDFFFIFSNFWIVKESLIRYSREWVSIQKTKQKIYIEISYIS